MPHFNRLEINPVPVEQMPEGFSPLNIVGRAWDNGFKPVLNQLVMWINREEAFSGPEVEAQIVQESVAKGILPITELGWGGFPLISLLNDISYRTIFLQMACALGRQGYTKIANLLTQATLYDYPNYFLEQKNVFAEINSLDAKDKESLPRVEEAFVAAKIRKMVPEQVDRETSIEAAAKTTAGNLLDWGQLRQEVLLSHPAALEILKDYQVISSVHQAGYPIDEVEVTQLMSLKAMDDIIAAVLPFTASSVPVSEVVDIARKNPELADLPEHHLQLLAQLVRQGVAHRQKELFPYFDAEFEFRGDNLPENIKKVSQHILDTVSRMGIIRLVLTILSPNKFLTKDK